MIRGLYTGSAGMMADMTRLNTISNNLANVDTTGYKKDTTIYKNFPEMLIRRTNDNGLNVVPAGSWDDMPIVGKLGTGVEVNEIYTRHEQGTLQKTDNDLDLALKGPGLFAVMTGKGERYTRDGAFFLNKEGYVVNKEGFKLMGENGPLQLKPGNFKITEQGQVLQNRNVDTPMSSKNQNEWRDPEVVDQIRVRTFPFLRELKKEGTNFYYETKHSGPPIPVDEPYQVKQGFLEKSNVNVVREMVKMIEVQRHYEANQKVMQTEDQSLGRLINNVAK